MRVEEAKTAIKALVEVNQERRDSCIAIESTGSEAAAIKKLFREGNQTKLIKWGLALIVFPEPTPISEIVGTGFVAAGAVKKGIQNRAAFVEDIGKDFKKALKEVNFTNEQIRI
jgi:hypothetical protein